VQVPPPACPGDRKPGWLQVEDLAEAVLYTLRQPAHVQLDEIGMTGI
jgi:meso-butanediol dehydrogenase/(S,S)-butanediol dehydrogenase/diacetyl reductase